MDKIFSCDLCGIESDIVVKCEICPYQFCPICKMKEKHNGWKICNKCGRVRCNSFMGNPIHCQFCRLKHSLNINPILEDYVYIPYRQKDLRV